MHRRQQGLTLLELVVTVAVLAILVSIGIPAFQSLVGQNRASSAANELQATLQFARSEAVSRDQPVTVCPADFSDPDADPATVDCSTSTQWQNGWIVQGLDEDGSAEVLRTRAAFHPSVRLNGAEDWEFSNTGTLEGQPVIHFDVEVSSGLGASRTLCMSLAGNSRIIRGDATC